MLKNSSIKDLEHARMQSRDAELSVGHLRGKPADQLNDEQRNALVVADFWARKSETPISAKRR